MSAGICLRGPKQLSGVSRPVLVCLVLAAAVRPAGAAPFSPPSNLVAGVSNCDSVVLTWTASPSSGVTGYRIYRNSAIIFTNSSTSTSFTDANPPALTNYTYTVSALKSGTESSPNPSASVAPCPDAVSPAAPASVTASVISYSQVSVAWSRSADVAGPSYEWVSGVQSYQVYRNGTNLIATIVDPFNTYLDTGAPSASSVYYSVRALDGSNNVSGFTVSAAVTTPPPPPGPPTGLTGSARSCSQASLSWTSPANAGSGVASFNVYRDGAIVLAAAANSATNSGLAPSKAYSYAVTTVDTLGRESSQSAPFAITTPACPVPGSSAWNVRLGLGNGRAGIQWVGTTGALYQVECAATPAGPWVPVDAPNTFLGTTNFAIQPSAIWTPTRRRHRRVWS